MSGSTFGKGGTEGCRGGLYGEGTLDSWGWLTQPLLVCDGCDLCSSRTATSVRKTTSPMSNEDFFSPLNIFYSKDKSNKKQLTVDRSFAEASRSKF